MVSDPIDMRQRWLWGLVGVVILALFGLLSYTVARRQPPPGQVPVTGTLTMPDALPETLTATTPGLDATATAMATAGCYTCHQPARRFIGPAWREIARKYAGNSAIVPDLVDKVRMGGGGVWGGVPMGPHPDLDAAQAETIVRYILAQTDTPAAAPASTAP